MNWIGHCIRGCKNLPGYGTHPGTPLVLGVLPVLVIVSMVKHGFFVGGTVGLVAWLFLVVPFYLMGAHGRSSEYGMSVRRKSHPDK